MDRLRAAVLVWAPMMFALWRLSYGAGAQAGRSRLVAMVEAEAEAEAEIGAGGSYPPCRSSASLRPSLAMNFA
jgi:hypothetical protein